MASESEEASGEASAIVVVDPDAASRNDAEDLEDEYDRQVIAIDSMDFDTESSEDVLEAGLFILGWDLGIRSGLDLLEEIREHPRLADRLVLMASAKPTPERVRWAMSLGANGFISLPYDAEQIGSYLEAAASGEADSAEEEEAA